jgi:hypothetical protein
MEIRIEVSSSVYFVRCAHRTVIKLIFSKRRCFFFEQLRPMPVLLKPEANGGLVLVYTSSLRPGLHRFDRIWLDN